MLLGVSSELGLSGNGAPGMSTGSGGSVGQFGSGHGSLYGSGGLAANMGSLQNIARSQPGPGQGPQHAELGGGQTDTDTDRPMAVLDRAAGAAWRQVERESAA